MALELYGNYISQPTRALIWMLKIKQVDFKLNAMGPGGPKFHEPEFVALNPNALVPVLKDGDFVLFEAYAIATYLASKFEWTDLYPKDLQARAKVDQYLHWHHNNSRLSTLRIFRPLMKQKANVATPQEEEWLAQKDEIISRYVAIIEAYLVNDFIAQTDAPTIADFACYCEFDQLEMADQFDFAKYPKVNAWMSRMEMLPFHDDVHEDLVELYTKNDMLKSSN